MKTLLKQALDALESIPTSFGNVAYTTSVQSAIEALRAAIDQPESEPVAWMTPDGMHAMPADEKDAWLESKRMLEAVTDYSIPLYAAPVQPDTLEDCYEPVMPEGYATITCPACGFEGGREVQPIYAPLTDPQIYNIAKLHPHIATLVPHLEVGEFARAIEKSAQQAAYEGDLLTIAYLDGVHAGKKTNCVPLSDEQIKAIQYSDPAFMTCSCVAFAHAIERAVRGEKP